MVSRRSVGQGVHKKRPGVETASVALAGSAKKPVSMGLHGTLGKVVRYLGPSGSGGVDFSADVLAVSEVMPWWRRHLCHIAPILFALAMGFVLASLINNHRLPRHVISTRIEPAATGAGEYVSVRYEAKDISECDGVIRRKLIDSLGMPHALPDATPYFRDPNEEGISGGNFNFSREFRIPRTVACGPAKYRARTKRWCNLIQQMFWPSYDSEEAEVTITKCLPTSLTSNLSNEQ